MILNPQILLRARAISFRLGIRNQMSTRLVLHPSGVRLCSRAKIKGINIILPTVHASHPMFQTNWLITGKPS